MELGETSILEAGSALAYVSTTNDISGPSGKLYFSMPSEAIQSLFTRFDENGVYQHGSALFLLNQPLFLNVFYLNKSLKVLGLNTTLDTKDTDFEDRLTKLIFNNCTNLADAASVSYITTFDIGNGEVSTGRMIAYMLCSGEHLVHAQSFMINANKVKEASVEIVEEWKRNNDYRFKMSIGSHYALLHSILTGPNMHLYLKDLALQPMSPGYATSQVNESPVKYFLRDTEYLSPSNPVWAPGAGDPYETMQGDLIRKIALNMLLGDINALCTVYKRFNREVCDNDVFWMNKVAQDYTLKRGIIITYDPLRSKPDVLSWKRYYREIGGYVSLGEARETMVALGLMNKVNNFVTPERPEWVINKINELRTERKWKPLETSMKPLVLDSPINNNINMMSPPRLRQRRGDPNVVEQMPTARRDLRFGDDNANDNNYNPDLDEPLENDPMDDSF